MTLEVRILFFCYRLNPKKLWNDGSHGYLQANSLHWYRLALADWRSSEIATRHAGIPTTPWIDTAALHRWCRDLSRDMPTLVCTIITTGLKHPSNESRVAIYQYVCDLPVPSSPVPQQTLTLGINCWMRKKFALVPFNKPPQRVFGECFTFVSHFK